MGFEIAAVSAAVGSTLGVSAATATFITQAAISTSLSVGVSLLQRALTSQQVVKQQGSRLNQSRIADSAEGSPIFSSYGKMRLGGQLIWSTSFVESRRTKKEKAGRGKQRRTVSETTTYSYTVSFAMGLCESEGDITLGRVWADGRLLTKDDYNFRFYDGDLTQLPDPKIQAVEGAANTPAHRGLAYVVFEDMPLANFGNRIPQITCEVIRNDTFGLGVTVQNLCGDIGLTSEQIDTTDIDGLTNEIDGFYSDALASPSSLLELLMDTYQIDAYEAGGKLVFIQRQNAGSFEIDEDDLVLRNGESFRFSRVKDTDLPDRLKVEFIDASRDYTVAAVDSHSVTGLSRRVDVFSTPAVMTLTRARSLADSLLHERHIARNQVELTLPFSSESSGLDYLSSIEVGSTFRFRNRTYRVRDVSYGDDIEIAAVGYNASVYTSLSYDEAPSLSDPTITLGATTAIFLDIPVADADAPNLWSPRIAVDANPWPGGVDIYRDDGSGGSLLISQLDIDAQIGTTIDEFLPGTPWQWDSTQTLTVNMPDNVTLISLSELSVLNGENAMLIETPSGEWEVFQFVNATLNGDGTYTLSKLLRGLLGTETVMDTVPPGSRVIVYDPQRLGSLSGSSALLGVELSLRHGPLDLLPDDDLYTAVTVTPRGVAYRPYAPTHLRQFNDGGDITLSWIRRARFDGDSWQTVTVPLNEDFERYEIDIYDGVDVVRTIVVDDTTSVTYSAAQQTADFGSAQQTVKWVVHQISAIYGRGSPATQEA